MNAKWLAVIVGVVVLCIAGVGTLGSIASPNTVDPSTGSILMIQPSGWFPSRDAHYAKEVNLPNSEAEKNNSVSRLNNAISTKIVSDAHYQDTERGGTAFASFISGIACLAVIIFIGAAFWAFVSYFGGGAVS